MLKKRVFISILTLVCLSLNTTALAKTKQSRKEIIEQLMQTAHLHKLNEKKLDDK